MNTEMKNHALDDGALETVAGGVGDAYAPYTNGDLVRCYMGNTGDGFSIYQLGRVKCYIEDEEGLNYNVELGGKDVKTGELYFTGEFRLFRVSQLKPYNG